MKIRYRVLWYDDHPESIREDIEPWIHGFLEDLGFECEFTLLEEYKTEKPAFWQRFDLIVTDLNLVKTGDGRRLVDDVRNGHILTDVLIYSANADALAEAVQRAPMLERVSIQFGRRDLERKLADLILITVKKAQTIPYIRGQFITQAIDLESQVHKLLMRAMAAGRFPSLSDSKTKLLTDYKKRKARFHEKRKSAIEAFVDDRLHELCEQDFVDAFDRHEFARHILKAAVAALTAKKATGDADLQALGAAKAGVLERVVTELNDFHSDVTKVRNTLAHVQEEVVDDKVVIKGRLGDGSVIELDDDWCKRQRAVLRKHVKNLEEILKLVA